jgi:hypothetical protein
MKGRGLLALAVLSLALACEGSQSTGPTGPSDPSKIIQDGAHSGGNKDFFFLPPMVPLPLHNPNFELGKFNNALRPSLRIEICELDGLHLDSNGVPTGQTACAAGVPLKKTFPAGTVNVVNLPLRENGWWSLFGLPADGFYYVLWDTRQSNLNVNKFYRISVFVQGKPDALGVADVDPMSSLRQWRSVVTGDVIQMVDDVMLPITFRVERGALCETGQCNSATITNNSPTGSQSITVDAGGGSITGATFPNGWLPSGSQCAPTNPCPQSVVVTINEVNTPGSGLPGESTVCHPALNPKLQQFRGCFNFSTYPKLQSFNDAGDQFAQPVTVAVCYELEGSTDPRRDFAELYASGPNEPPHPLDDISEGVLVVSKDCARPAVIGYRGSNPLLQLASSGWQKLKGGLDQAFGVKTAHAVDLGLGGIVKGFSNISPVLSANIAATSSTELSLDPGATTHSTVRISGSHHHADHAQTGIAGLQVTFAAPSGALSAATATTNADGSASVDWTMPDPALPGTYTYTLTADGPALGGPVTFTATVDRKEVWHVIERAGWNGTWTRRGSSGVFDGVWVPAAGSGSPVTAVMDYTRSGLQVHFQRTSSSEGALCSYDGNVAADGLSGSGTETCPGDPQLYRWDATISAPYPPPPPPPVPDFTITTGSPVLSPSTIENTGGSVHIGSFTIQNQGGSFALEGLPMRSGVYLSTDPVITSEDRALAYFDNTPESLGAGASFTRPFVNVDVPALPAGNYYIGILIDIANRVSEANEGNNYVSAPFVIAPASLTVDGVMSAGEWTNATQYGPFLVNLPYEGQSYATLYLKNTSDALYGSLQFTHSISAQTNIIAAFRFDGNFNGVWDSPDDGFVVQQRIDGARADRFFDEFFTCAVTPCQGQTDREWGGSNDGETASTDGGPPTTIEFVKRFNTADSRDASISWGQTLRFSAFTNIGETGSLLYTDIPGTGWFDYRWK